MNRISWRALAIAVCISGFAGLAHATPIYFDFTGTVDGHSPPQDGDGLTGTAVSGGFTFDTERLFESRQTSPIPTVSFLDWQPANLTEPLAFLNLADRSVSWPLHAGSNYSAIVFNDSCNSTGCQPQLSENFVLQAISDEAWPTDFTGTRRSTMLLFFNNGETVLPDYPFREPFDFFDSAAVDATSITTLPLHSLFGLYADFTYDCVAGACTTVRSEQLGFSIDSVSRGVGTRSVPEPGTLGLLGVALAGLILARRRRAVSSGPFC